MIIFEIWGTKPFALRSGWAVTTSLNLIFFEEPYPKLENLADTMLTICALFGLSRQIWAAHPKCETDAKYGDMLSHLLGCQRDPNVDCAI